MQIKRERKKLVIDIVVEIIVLAAFVAAMFFIESGYALDRQRGNSQLALDTAYSRLDGYAKEAKAEYEEFDSFNTAKAGLIALFLDRNPAYSGGLQSIAQNCGVDELYITDKSGTVADMSGVFETDFTGSKFESLFSNGGAVSTAEMRYYISKYSDGNRAVIIGMSLKDITETTGEMRSYEYSLSHARVGSEGAVIAVKKADGTVIYDKNGELTGLTSKALIGVTAGFDGIVDIGGSKYYCRVGKSIDDADVLVAAVPASELINANKTAFIWSAAIFFVMLSLMVAYVHMLRMDRIKHPERKEPAGQGVMAYFSTKAGKNMAQVFLIGLIAIFLLSFYAQTLTTLSRQSSLSDKKLKEVTEYLDDNEARYSELKADYDDEYAQRAKTISYLIGLDTGMIDDDVLSQLAKRADILSIYVIDGNGKTVATNTVYKDFVLSSDEKDQSNEFWKVIKGYKETIVQEPHYDDSAEHIYTQYVGTMRQDGAGMIQIQLSAARIGEKLKTTETGYVLSRINVRNGGFLFAADKDKITAVSSGDIAGKTLAAVGLDDSVLKDGYSDCKTINGTQYFLSGIQYGDQYIYVAIPTDVIYNHRLAISLYMTLAYAVAMSILTLRVLMSLKREEKEEEAVPTEKAGDSVMFERVMPSGKTKNVQTAGSRWQNRRIPWADKLPEQKLHSLILGAVKLAAIFIVIAVLAMGGSYNKSSILSYIMSCQWERSLNVFSLTYVGIVFVEIIVFSTIIRKIIVLLTSSFGARSETIGRLLDSFIKYIAVIGAVFYCMSFVGVDTTTIVTSAGILTVVVGLGANKIIGDILAGIFMVFEGEFRVGDIVTIGGWRGTVLEIGIRTTKIEDAGNNIKIFNNTGITDVINMTKQYSYASCDIGIEYSESLERVEGILQKELPKLKEKLSGIEQGPFYKGVVSLGDSSVVIRILATCREENRIQLTRDLNRAMKLMFDRYHISIPYPQVVVNKPAENSPAAGKRSKNTDEFVKEQGELSKNMFVDE